MEKAKFQFMFMGSVGYVFAGDFVSWGGAWFQIEAAGAELRAAIESARGAI